MIETIRNFRYQPCKGCPDRYIACSDHCQKPEFLEWKAEQAKIREARKQYDNTTNYTVEQIRRNRQRCK